jgi:thermitase
MSHQGADKMNRKTAITLMAITVAITAAFANTQRCEYVQGRLLAKFKAGITLNTEPTLTATGNTVLDSLNATYRCTTMEPLLPRTTHCDADNPLSRVYVFTFKTTTTMELLVTAYMKTGLFAYAEPDYVTHGSSAGGGFIPNDQYFNRQWALHNDATFNMSGAFTPKAGADIKMPEAWEIEQGDTAVIIAILDSGCKMDHPELAGRLWKNPGEIPGNGIDDDGNGFIDDVNGWDFVNNDNDPSDDNGHGTAIAGIIGANTNNGIGFAGVNPNARIIIVKILDAYKRGNTSNTVLGINYAIMIHAKVINLSLGGENLVQTEALAIENTESKNITIVSPTGNSNLEKVEYPAAYKQVIAVGASSPADQRYSFSDTAGSNYGSEIDIVAPGTYIFYLDEVDNNKYGLNSTGTSYSTAYVTGVVSLLLAKNPTLTPAQIQDILQKSADDQVGDPAEDTKGWDKYFGWGRLNAFKALTMASATTKQRYLPPQLATSKSACFLTITNNLVKFTGTTYYALNGKLLSNHTNNSTKNTLSTGLYIYSPK